MDMYLHLRFCRASLPSLPDVVFRMDNNKVIPEKRRIQFSSPIIRPAAIDNLSRTSGSICAFVPISFR